MFDRIVLKKCYYAFILIWIISLQLLLIKNGDKFSLKSVLWMSKHRVYEFNNSVPIRIKWKILPIKNLNQNEKKLEVDYLLKT